MNNICIDVEGLSTQPNSVIVTIAAVRFNFTDDKTETFCVNVDPRSGKELGLHISKETLDWWRLQKPEAVKAWQHSQLSLSDAMGQLTTFCGDCKDTLFYAQGTNYDFPVLESSYRAVGIQEPWKYYNLRDLRTIYWLAQFDTKKAPRVGTYHNALDDCLTQISWLKSALGAKKDI